MDTQAGASRDKGGGGSAHKVAVDLMDRPPKHHMIPVWFFIGLILLIYGILIFATGIYELSRLPSTVLANLHAPIWWGVILAVVGAIYVRRFYPRKS